MNLKKNTHQRLAYRWYRAMGPNDLIPVELRHTPSNQLLVHRVLQEDILPTRQVRNRLLQHNIHKNDTMIWGSNCESTRTRKILETSVSTKSRTPPSMCVSSVTICSQPDEDAKSHVALPCKDFVEDPSHSSWWALTSPKNKKDPILSTDCTYLSHSSPQTVIFFCQIAQDSGTHIKIMTASTYPDNYEITTSILNCAVYMPKKPSRKHRDNPRNRSTSSLSNSIGLPKPEIMNSEMNGIMNSAWKRQESKKNTSPPLAVRDISDKFLCRSRILAYTKRHDLCEAFGPGAPNHANWRRLSWNEELIER